MKNKIIPGSKVNELTVLGPTNQTKDTHSLWLCRCSCGVQKLVKKTDLNRKKVKTCGKSENHRLDYGIYKGKTFHYWTVIENTFDKKCKILCKCKCGTERRVNIFRLLKGVDAFSCGCYNRELLKKSNTKKPGVSALNRLFRVYKKNALKKQKGFYLSKKDFHTMILKNCFYCDIPPNKVAKNSKTSTTFLYNGIDCVDPTSSYRIDNCVPCCIKCNSLKRDISLDICLKVMKLIRIKKELLILKTKLKDSKPLNRIIQIYKYAAKKRNFYFKLSKNLFYSLIKSPCFYCGRKYQHSLEIKNEKILYNGIDRLDNSKGYFPNNCVPCCRHCNTKKSGTTISMMIKILAFKNITYK